MFELLGVRVVEWFLWESIGEGSTGIQKQFELLEVRVIGGWSYQECTVCSCSYAYPEEQRKLLVLSSALFFSCSCCFCFSHPLSSEDFWYHKFKNVSKAAIRVSTEINLFKALLIIATTPLSQLQKMEYKVKAYWEVNSSNVIRNFKSLAFLHLHTLLSGQRFDAGLPSSLWCAVFPSIEARRCTLKL